MLINLNLSNLLFLYKILLIFVCQLVDAFQNENHQLTTPLNTHYYSSRVYESFLDPTQFDENYAQLNNLNDSPPESVEDNLNQDLNDSNNESNELDKVDLASLHSLNRLTKRNGQSHEEAAKKEIIELNSLNDDDTYAITYSNQLNAVNDENKSLMRYKEERSPELEYPNNLLDEEMLLAEKHLAAADIDFSYDEQDEWPGHCNDPNARQSPIALNARDSRLDLRTKLDIGVKYAKNLPTVELENKGHTVQFNIPRTAGDLIITGPALDYEVYKAEAIHFHWGSNDSVGSEHVINDERFPLEMHIVHSNTKYKSLEEALKHPDGTVVIGIMFKIGKMNEAIDPLIRALDKIRCKGQKTDLRDMNVLRLFPIKVRRFYQYYGSLTTPPCTPAVNWIVLETPSLISSEQVAKFRRLTEDVLCQNPILRNWRDLQDRKNRDIKRSIRL